MKNSLKMGFHESVVPQVFDRKISTWRLRDHKFKKGDVVAFENSQTKEIFGLGKIIKVIKTTVGQIDLKDKTHYKTYENRQELIKAFKRHNPAYKVNNNTPVFAYTYKFMKNKTGKYNKGLKMYFSREIAEKFAELEQNEKNFKVSEIVDRILMQETKELSGPIRSAELGGGAHPDRYHEFFGRLLEKPLGHIDWVDISPYMLELAEKYISSKKYQNRGKVITFIESDIMEYLRGLQDEKLDVAIMKYTIDHIADIDTLFKLLSAKLKRGGKLIATIGTLNPELRSFSTNARFLYNGKEFPDNETRTLKDGDSFMVKFFKVSGDPNSEYLEGAEAIKYFHSAKKIRQAAELYGFDIFLGDWKDFVLKASQGGQTLDQEILVLTRK